MRVNRNPKSRELRVWGRPPTNNAGRPKSCPEGTAVGTPLRAQIPALASTPTPRTNTAPGWSSLPNCIGSIRRQSSDAGSDATQRYAPPTAPAIDAQIAALRDTGELCVRSSMTSARIGTTGATRRRPSPGSSRMPAPLHRRQNPRGPGRLAIQEGDTGLEAARCAGSAARRRRQMRRPQVPSWYVKPSGCVGARPRGINARCVMLLPSWRSLASSINAAPSSPHRRCSRCLNLKEVDD